MDRPRGTAINHCEVPPWIIASEEFNDHPIQLRLTGVRETNRRFFARLDTLSDPNDRALVFHDYLDVKFALHQWRSYAGSARDSLRNSYVRFLRGWGFDSSSIEGAVLKSWVQSRFGITPTYHRGILQAPPGEEDMRFAIDRMKGCAKTNDIYSQLDLLYEFCQYELAKRWPGVRTRVLYRGTNDPDAHPHTQVGPDRRACVRLNNLVSFTADRERAWEFGSAVWKTTVPLTKVLFFSDLLPDSLLKGEEEYLVVGGDFWIEELLY